MAFVRALLIGKARQYGSAAAADELGKAWRSAIFKNAQTGEIYAGELGFEGDEVADTEHHGGVNKAVFANSLENYPAWEAYLGLKNLPLGATGENLTVSGLDETSVSVGDVHKIGSLVLQVTQPRKPCFKLAKRWGNANLAKEIFATGLTGWYYKVLENGSCSAGCEIEILQKNENALSVMQINKLFFNPSENLDLLPKFRALEVLPASWQDDINRRLNGSYSTAFMEKL